MLSLLLLAPAFAAPMQDTASGMDAAPCYGAYPTDIVPLDGSGNVSPATVPAVFVNADCGAGALTVMLSAGADDAWTTTVPVDHTGLYWLTDITLVADRTYVLSVSAEDWGTLTSTFHTGSGPISVTGVPTLSIVGSHLQDGGSNAAVSLQIGLVPDPSGAIYTLSRDGAVVSAGIGSGTVIDGFRGEDGQEVCYTVTQVLGDGSELGTSTESCVTLLQGGTDVTKSGCSAVGANTALLPALGALLALLGVRRNRA